MSALWRWPRNRGRAIQRRAGSRRHNRHGAHRRQLSVQRGAAVTTPVPNLHNPFISSSKNGETPGPRPSYFFAIQSWCPRSVFPPSRGATPMANTSSEIGAPLSRPPMSLVSRFIGIITSPKATFEAVVAHPRWFGIMALTTVIIAIGASLPLTTEGGQQSQVDQQVRSWKASAPRSATSRVHQRWSSSAYAAMWSFHWDAGPVPSWPDLQRDPVACSW